MWLIVEVLKGGQAGKRFEFKDKTTVTVGRRNDCDVTLDPRQDRLVSGKHGEVRLTAAGEVWWVDNQSSNGSFVQGNQVAHCKLEEKGVVELGPGGPQLCISCVSPAPQPAASQPAPSAPPSQASGAAVSGSAVGASAGSASQPAPSAPPPQASGAAVSGSAVGASAGSASQRAPSAPPPQASGAAVSGSAVGASAGSVPGPQAVVGEAAASRRVGKKTVARIVEQALAQERTRKPRSTRFLQSFVDKEVRKSNKGLFYTTLVLGVLLLGAVITGAVVFLSQRSELKEKDRKYKKALAQTERKATRRIAELTEEQQKNTGELRKAIKKVGNESERGPLIAKMNKNALYLLAYGRVNRPRYAACTAFAIGKRILATNAHCVEIVRKMTAKGAHFYVVQNQNATFRAEVVATAKHPRYRKSSKKLTPDVALLKVEKDLPKQVKLASKEEAAEVAQGSTMFSFGFPGRLADPRKPVATLVAGHIGRVTKFDASMGSGAENQLLQHSALSMGGASGSPLFNSRGKVIGLHAGSYAAQSTQTLLAGGKQAKVRMAKRLGYKYGIRVDVLSHLMQTPSWHSVKTSGVMALVKEVPAALKKVNCARLGKKVRTCSKDKNLARSFEHRCNVSKKIPSQSSISFLLVARCMNAVKGCSKTAFSNCLKKGAKK